MKVTMYKDLEQRSIAWTELRNGKNGSSEKKNIIDAKTGNLKSDKNKDGSLKAKTPILSAIAGIIAEIKTGFSNDSDFQSDAMLWGTETEEEAINEIATPESFQCGYVTNSDYKYHGLSPDLLNPKKGSEIKCPNSKTFALWKIKGVLPEEHKCQVMSYFVIMPDLDEMDFVVFDPRYHEKNMFKFVVKRSENLAFIANMSNAMKEFDKLVDTYIKLF